MNLDDLRIAATLIAFGLFLGILCWAWRPARRADFEHAAALPFADGEPGERR